MRLTELHAGVNDKDSGYGSEDSELSSIIVYLSDEMG
jgi:hypothetical protein